MSKTRGSDLSPMKHEDGSDQDYEAHNAYRNMVDADAHRANPKMMKRVAKVAERHMKTAKKVMGSVADIKEFTKKTYPPKKRYEREDA
jgi:hypothetical protein